MQNWKPSKGIRSSHILRVAQSSTFAVYISFQALMRSVDEFHLITAATMQICKGMRFVHFWKFEADEWAPILDHLGTASLTNLICSNDLLIVTISSMRDCFITESWTDVHWLMADSTDSHKLDMIDGERDSFLLTFSTALSTVILSMFLNLITEIYIFSVP